MSSWKVSVCPPSTFAIIAASSLSSAGGGIRSPAWCAHVWVEACGDEGIEREAARAEDQNQKRGEEEGICIGFVELVRIAEDGKKSIVLGRPVSDEHRSREQQRDGPREQAEDEEYAADELKRGDEVRVERGEGNVE